MDTHTSSPYFASAGPPAPTMSSSLLLLRPRPPPARTLDCLSRFARFAASKTEPLIQHNQPRPFPTFESDTSQQTQSSSSAPIDTPPATPTPLPSPSSVSPRDQTSHPQALPTIRALPSYPSSSVSFSSSFASSSSSSSSAHATQASHAPKRAQTRSPAKSEQQSHTQTLEYTQPESPPRKRISTSPRKTSPKAQTHDSHPPASSGATQEPPIPLPPFKVISDRQSARAFMSAVRGLFVSRATPSTSGRQDPMPNFGCGLLFDGIDPNSESPVVKGNVYGISIYGGPEWSHDDAPITILDFRSKGVFEETRDFLASQKYRKAFHNISVCTHLIHRLDHTITNGIVADTMHMARLHDTGLESYKLRYLSKRYLPSSMTSLLPLRETRGQGRPSLASADKTQQQYRDSADPYRAVDKLEDAIEECPIEMYQKPKERKDQTMDILLDEEPYRQQILEFAATDAYLTWHLHSYMCELLSKSPWVLFDQKKNGNMHQFYISTWLPFGILLTDMERRGVKVDTQLLKTMETQAVEELAAYEKQFLDWASSFSPQAKFMNISSPQQKSFLLFGKGEKSFLVDNVDNVIEPGKKKPLKKKTIILKGLGLRPTSGRSSDDSKSADHEHASTGASILKALAGNPNAKEPNYGHLEDQLPKEDAAVASHAIHALLKRTSVSTLLQTFIIPLQELAAKTSNHRIHTSLNLQTQTGRLSSRHPNLQNQPSYGKDKYGIRRAFIPERGNKFIIADYSQLELRLLAHLTDCRSMIDAFKAGGFSLSPLSSFHEQSMN
eukprot:TRINITY_DN6204_c0_g1_i5.p1 TRINITY_DN6204_c0_g1~~TRINITY_DN6204_c0_g1_i5.p1  ORF type:complete len:782 (-),score=120.16 TRINITY_DN6204_c0_g1_i5:995-3340(-)